MPSKQFEPRGLGTCLSFYEMTGIRATRERLAELLSQFSRSAVMQSVGVVSAVLEWGSEPNWDSHDNLVREAFRRNDADKLLAACHSAIPARPLFHRQQILLIAKEAILNCSDKGLDATAMKEWGGLGLAFLMASDLLYEEMPAPTSTQELTTQTLYRTLLAHEFSNRLTVNYKIARAQIMRDLLGNIRVGPSTLSIEKIFAEATGMEIRQFQALCLAVLSHCLSVTYDGIKSGKVQFRLKKSFFESGAIESHLPPKLLEATCADSVKLRKAFTENSVGVFDMTPFKTWPIYLDNDGDLLVMDAQYLAEKLESGIFWTVHNHLSGQDRQTLHSAWGKSFEAYMHWLIGTSVEKGSHIYYANPVFDKTGDEVCDAIILCGRDAIFMEYKGRTFTSKAKYGGEAEVLAREFDKYLIGTEQEKKGVIQLVNAIKKAFDPSLPLGIRNIDVSKIDKVFPVLITRDDIGGSFLVARYINEKFKNLINKGIYRNITITPAFTLSAEGMETITPYLVHYRMSEILEAWFKRDRNLTWSFLSVQNPVMAAAGFRPNEVLRQKFTELMNECSAIVFPKDSEHKKGAR